MKTKGESRARIGIRLKLLMLVTACVFLIIAVQSVVMIVHDLSQSRMAESQRLLVSFYNYKDMQSLFEKMIASLARGFALRRDLQQSLFQRDREATLDLLLPAYAELKAIADISRLTVHGPDGALFVAAHGFSQPHDPNDGSSGMIAAAAAKGEALAGLERQEDRLSVLAVAPVFQEENRIGFVTVGMDFDQTFWENQSVRTGLEYRIRIAAGSPQSASTDANDMLYGTSLRYASTIPEPFPALEESYVRALERMKPETVFLEDGSKRFAVLVAPLLGHGKRIIGVMEMIQSREAALAAQRRGHFIVLSAAVGIAVAGLVLLGFAVRAIILKPLGHLVEIASRQLKGDPDARVTLLPADEFGQLGRTFNILSSQLAHTLSTQKKTIGALQKTQDMLRSSEEKFREITELLPETIFESDPSGKLRFVNQNAFQHFGYSREDIETGLEIFHLIAPEDQDKVRRSVEQILRGGSAGLEEIHARRKNGTSFPAIFQATPVLRDGVSVGYRGFIIDVTETKQLEIQLQHSQKMEAIGRLAGGVAHDFNNLLSPIIGYSELLLADLSAEDPKRRAVERMHRAGEKARDLARQLLAFGRKQALEVKPVSINEVISGFEKLLRRTIRENIHLRVHLEKSVPNVMADVGQLEQVIMNLIVNAQDAIAGDGVLTIETGCVRTEAGDGDIPKGMAHGEYAMLAIRDTGCGMDPDTCRRIFEPFYTTKEKGEGSGLGLATVFGIVKQHGGNINVVSEPGEGAVFKIYLPAAEEAVASTKAPKMLKDTQGTETIMVVEDDDNVRDLAEAILKRQGYEVISAHSAEECLRLLRLHRGPLHILLTDVIMPGMNGRELAVKVRERYPEAKVVFMSGYTNDAILHQGVLGKDVHYLQKPFSARHLASRVREVADS